LTDSLAARFSFPALSPRHDYPTVLNAPRSAVRVARISPLAPA
jgi:hypothetical protein